VDARAAIPRRRRGLNGWPLDEGAATWSVALGAMLSSGRKWDSASFACTVRVRYEPLGLAVLSVPPGSTTLQTFGQPWPARSHCRLFADPGDGPSLTVDDWTHGAALPMGTKLTCTEELGVEGASWRARISRRAGSPESDSYRVPQGDRRPGWLVDHPPLAIPHSREMLDPALVLSAVELDSIVEEEDGWLLRGKPRKEGMAHGYYPAIVHPYGDLWTALLHRGRGHIVRCRTTLKGADLASHDLVVQILDSTAE